MTLYNFKLSLTSPETIIKWCTRKYSKFTTKGEITEPLTINLKTGKPYLNGLFCERIFGSIVPWVCFCGYIAAVHPEEGRKEFTNIITCDQCLMEVTDDNLRRHRFGYIKLEVPILNSLYFNITSLILNITEVELNSLIYYKKFNFINNSNFNVNIPSQYKISELMFITNYLFNKLQTYNLLHEISLIKDMMYNLNYIYKKKLINKLQILKLCFLNNLNLSWLFITILPILPANLRPYTQLDNKIFIIDPINELYKIIIIKNNRLKRWSKVRKTTPILFEILDKKNLQQSIDLLLQNKKDENTFKFLNKISEKLTNLNIKLYSKYGLFRQGLLGKRVDYSGRSVITPQPNLNLKEVGIPFELGFTLYKPKLIQSIKLNNLNCTYLKSKLYSQYKLLNIKYILNNILLNENVLINRAPTLHKMNIQAFKPTLSEGETIKLYPLACTGFNADFDGDQVGIFGFLSNSANIEASYNISSEKNVYSPAKVGLLVKPNQAGVLGLYSLLTSIKTTTKSNIICSNLTEIKYLIKHKLISLSSPVWVKIYYKKNNKFLVHYILTTAGRSIFTSFIL